MQLGRRALAGLLLSTTLISCSEISVTPGNTTTSTRAVSDFTKLEVSNGFEVTIIPDSTNEVKIEAPEGYQPYIRTVVEGGTLKVYFDDDVDEDEATPKRATIRAKHLDGITVSGGCHVTSTGTLSSENFLLESSGGSKIVLPLTVGTLRCTASGGSAITLSGSATTATAEFSGGSALHAFDLLAQTFHVTASGGSQLEVRASTGITVEASGGSRIYYKGTISDVSLSGGSEIIKVE